MTEETDPKLPTTKDQNASAPEAPPVPTDLGQSPSQAARSDRDLQTTEHGTADPRTAEPGTASRAESDDDSFDAVDERDADESDELENEAEAADEAQRDPRRPAFLDDLPDNPELRPLIEAFIEGNYARLRSLEHELRKKTQDPELIALARELVERTEPDPLAKKLLALSIVFFLFIVGWVYLHHAH